MTDTTPGPSSPAPDSSIQAPSDQWGTHHPPESPTGKRLAFLTLAALGIVYGDIGTSPLYTIKECFNPVFGIAPTPTNIYGILSLILWALVLVVSVKYCGFILRADNRGEGGILALLALALDGPRQGERGRRRRVAIILLGLFAAGLLYGDGMITPAISVLGAFEGLTVVAPQLDHLVLPLTGGILLALFLVQRFGTSKVGAAFGPITALWFFTIGTLGAMELVRSPKVLLAVNPMYGVQFFLNNQGVGFVVLGAVLLAITGAEALYADLGHLGKRPIRVGWFGLALPCLLLNYFGQGALVLREPAAINNPFFQLAPAGFGYPLLAISTAAAIIASQAVISGTFSITQQCVQLGYWPRVTIKHTSAREVGQIYIPGINYALMVGCLLVAFGFRSVASLGAAYGIAVMGTMSATTILFTVVALRRMQWAPWRAALFLVVFLSIDLAFLSAATTKIPHGGWFPLVAGGAIFALMTTWKRGRTLLREKLAEATLSVDLFLEDIGRNPRLRVAGTAVFMTSEPTGVPTVLLHHLKHNKVLHEQVLLLSILPAGIPEVAAADRVKVQALEHGFYRVTAHYGFMETPDVKEVLKLAAKLGVKTKPLETSYFLGRERLIPIRRKRGEHGLRLALWRKKLFAIMSSNAIPATQFFGIPPNRAVELGTQIEI
jgi:KUP system potassium uptake protein